MRSARGVVAPALVALVLGMSARAAAVAPRAQVQALTITILSDNVAGDEGVAEWGFAALVEADGRRVLFDTGAQPDTVQRNLKTLKLDVADVTDVVISHCHGDHIGGLLTLRRDTMKRNPKALSRVHVGRGCFWPRVTKTGAPVKWWMDELTAWRRNYEQTGGVFVEHAGPTPILPGVLLTGPIPRINPEHNYPPDMPHVREADGKIVPDTVPDDQALVVMTPRGTVILSGCSHAGMINLIERARVLTTQPAHAVIGGFHLLAATEEQLEWTAQKLKALGVGTLVASHCTGIEALFRLRALTGLPPERCTLGGTGRRFTLAQGLSPSGLLRPPSRARPTPGR